MEGAEWSAGCLAPLVLVVCQNLFTCLPVYSVSVTSWAKVAGGGFRRFVQDSCGLRRQ